MKLNFVISLIFAFLISLVPVVANAEFKIPFIDWILKNHNFEPSDVIQNITSGNYSLIDNKKLRIQLEKKISGANVEQNNINETRQYSYKTKNSVDIVINAIRQKNGWIINNVNYAGKDMPVNSLVPLTDAGTDFMGFASEFLSQNSDEIKSIYSRKSIINGIYLVKNNKLEDISFVFNFKQLNKTSNHGWILVNFTSQPVAEKSNTGISLDNITSIDITDLESKYYNNTKKTPEPQIFNGNGAPVITSITCDDKRDNGFVRVKIDYANNNRLINPVDSSTKGILLIEGFVANNNLKAAVKTNNCGSVQFGNANGFLSIDIRGFGYEINRYEYSYDEKGSPYIDFYYR